MGLQELIIKRSCTRHGQRRHYRRLTVIFTILLCQFMIAVIIAASLHDDRYPPTITNSISLDAKIKFLRNNKQLFGSRTVVAGSSLCLNNLDVAFLNRTLPWAAPCVNLSAWGMQIESTDFFLDFFLAHASHVQNVVLIGQMVDFRSSRSGGLFDRKEVWSYISGREDLLFRVRHFNLFKSLKNWQSFDRLSDTNKRYEGLMLDETGSVMLDIPESMLDGKRWNTYGLETETNEEAYRCLEAICVKLRSRNLHYIFLVPPVRQAFRSHVASFQALEDFKEHVRRIVIRNGGIYVDADSQLHLKDDCFVDMMHLNRNGARKVAELLAPLL